MSIEKSEFNAIETVTGGNPVITTDHALIHDSKAYSASNKFTIVAAGIAYLEIIVPANAYIHFKPSAIQSDGPKITIQLIEAPTITTGSTPIIPVNRKRINSPSSVVVIKNNPTAVSGGTILDQDYLGGGGTGDAKSGVQVSSDNEWVLKQNTTYVLKITNGGLTSSDVNAKLFWYEESGA